MNFKQASTPRLVSKFIATYDKLFEGFTPFEITPNESITQFWANLLALDVDQSYLATKIRKSEKDALLTAHKPFINSLFSACLTLLRTSAYEDGRKGNAIETFSVVLRCCLEKNLAGWEAMDLFAGGVAESDSVFLDLVGSIDSILADVRAPVKVKHQVLQMAVVFACSINQLSPGAYLLRINLFPALVKIIKEPETEAFVFEAGLLLAIISNFHRTDAAKLNPYLRTVKDTEDRDMLRCLAYSANFTVDSVVKAYQEISDDSPPTFATSMSNLFASFRPDRALSSTPVETPRELFKNHPIEAAVILISIHDFVSLNTSFNAILLEPLILQSTQSASQTAKSDLPPLIYTLLTVSSYVLTHASSVNSPRATAYAFLCFVTLLHLVENDVAMSAFLQPGLMPIRLCRQRLPLLPLVSSARPPIGAFLDCCVLWLRHNLHKRLEVRSYIACIWILQRIVWFASKTKWRVDYHWEELWRSLIALLDFLANKLEVTPSSRAEQLVQETFVLLSSSLLYAESFLASPQAVHQLVYEVVRSSSILQKHQAHCKPPARNTPLKAGTLASSSSAAMQKIQDLITHYERQVQDGGLNTAVGVVRSIGKSVERDGLFGSKEKNDEDAPTHSNELGEVGFIRIACSDGLALMPGPDQS